MDWVEEAAGKFLINDDVVCLNDCRLPMGLLNVSMDCIGVEELRSDISFRLSVI